LNFFALVTTVNKPKERRSEPELEPEMHNFDVAPAWKNFAASPQTSQPLFLQWQQFHFFYMYFELL
jgi:hypothetical protein